MREPISFRTQDPQDVPTFCAIQVLYLLEKIQSTGISYTAKRMGRPAEIAYRHNGSLRVLLESRVHVVSVTQTDIRHVAGPDSASHLAADWARQGRTETYIRSYLPARQPSEKERAIASVGHIQDNAPYWKWRNEPVTARLLRAALQQDTAVQLEIPRKSHRQTLVVCQKDGDTCWTYDPVTGYVNTVDIATITNAALPHHAEIYSSEKPQLP